MEREGPRFVFRTPASIQCYGPSMAGKTTLALRIVSAVNDLFDPVPQRVYWASTTSDVELPEYVTRLDGMPSVEDLAPNSLLVLDDLATSFAHDKKAAKALEALSSMHTHHRGLTTLTIFQNAFSQNRTSRVNATHLLFLRSHSDALQQLMLGRQLFPQEPDVIHKSMQAAARVGERYVVVSLHPSEEKPRILTRIFEGEDTLVFEPDPH